VYLTSLEVVNSRDHRPRDLEDTAHQDHQDCLVALLLREAKLKDAIDLRDEGSLIASNVLEVPRED
jgi:hypothetical protein